MYIGHIYQNWKNENYFDSFGNTSDQKPQNKDYYFFRYILKVPCYFHIFGYFGLIFAKKAGCQFGTPEENV